MRKSAKCISLIVAAAMVASVLPAIAQDIPGQSPREKTARTAKQQERRAIERAYQATRKNMPAAQSPSDPWAGMRGQDEKKK